MRLLRQARKRGSQRQGRVTARRLLPLTPGTEIGTPCPDHLADNHRPTRPTRKSCTSIDKKTILEGSFFSLSPHKISDTRPLTTNGFFTNLRDEGKKPLFFLFAKGIEPSLRMELTPKEDFACVDIADPSNFFLIKEEILEAALPPQKLSHPLKGIRGRKGIDTQTKEEGVFLSFQEIANLSETPLVTEGNPVSGREEKGEVFVGERGSMSTDEESSGHSQMNGQSVLSGEFPEKPLAMARETLYPLGENSLGKGEVRGVFLYGEDRKPLHKPYERATDYLHLRKLRHGAQNEGLSNDPTFCP